MPLLIVYTMFAVLCCFSNLWAQDVTPASLQRAKARLIEAVDSAEVAGAAHMVVRNGQVIYFEVAGVRDIEDKKPLERDTIMRIYSMSKPITSVAAMTLHEQGKFRLDDPISKFIPAFAGVTVLVKEGEEYKGVTPERPITVRDAFRHTTGYSYSDSGIPDLDNRYRREGMHYHGPHGMFPPKMTLESGAESLARIPLVHQPGERFTYGFSTDLLGRLIEVWSGKPLDKYLRASVFDPLEMLDTDFSLPTEKRDRFATCHTRQDGKLAVADKAATSPYMQGFEFLSGGGGLVSTMQDYANFCQMLVDGGHFKGRRVLQDATVELMFTDQLNGVAGGFQFGLGFAIADVDLGSEDSKRRAKQYSWGGYASTDFRLVPEQKLFQVVMRQLVPSSHDFANELIGIVYGGVEPVSQDGLDTARHSTE